MAKQIIQSNESSSIIWNNLEEMVRMKVREFIQNLLEAEVEELLGRQKSERRKPVDSLLAYRNGYGKQRRLTLDFLSPTTNPSFRSKPKVSSNSHPQSCSLEDPIESEH